MKGRSIIQRILALVVLLLFTLSITPKKYLHDCIADHIDYCSINLTDDPTVSQADFDCDCEDIVVSSPFIDVGLSELNFPPFSLQCQAADRYSFYFFVAPLTKDSRGPPAHS